MLLKSSDSCSISKLLILNTKDNDVKCTNLPTSQIRISLTTLIRYYGDPAAVQMETQISLGSMDKYNGTQSETQISLGSMDKYNGSQSETQISLGSMDKYNGRFGSGTERDTDQPGEHG